MDDGEENECTEFCSSDPGPEHGQSESLVSVFPNRRKASSGHKSLEEGSLGQNPVCGEWVHIPPPEEMAHAGVGEVVGGQTDDLGSQSQGGGGQGLGAAVQGHQVMRCVVVLVEDVCYCRHCVCVYVLMLRY